MAPARRAHVLSLALPLLVLLPTRGGGPGPPRLLLLLTVDTLRADRLGAYGNPLGLTPHLDRLASQGYVFTAAYAPAPFTLPSLAALMTGRHPEELGVLRNNGKCKTTA